MSEDELLVVGKSIPKPDAKVKVTGVAEYTGDMRFPGMLFGKILRSPYPHARVVKIDKSKAERLPGVKVVLTPKDVPNREFCAYWRESKDLQRLPADERILQDTVRFVGDRVAALAAVDERTADEALKLIDVEYELLPAVFNEEEAMKPEAPKIHGVEQNVAAHISMGAGNIEQGFKEADYIFEDEYKLPMQHPCPMEPHAYVADYNPVEKELTVWSSTQGTFNVRFLLSEILGMPMNKIRVIKPFVGGGFGGKNPIVDEPICALLAIRTGKPVKLVYSRGDELAFARRRHSVTIKLKAGFKKDGTLTAKQMKAFLNTGAYIDAGPKVTNTLGHRWMMLYRAPHIMYDGYAVYTNTSPASSMRGFGTTQQTFAWESMLDVVAEKLSIDPLELRLKNIIRSGDIDPYSGQTIASCELAECIRQGAKRIFWGKRKKGGERADNVKKRGMGMGCGTHNTGVWPYVRETSSAIVKVNEDGTASLLVGECDLGQGSETVFSQICAEALGVLPEDITVLRTADTAIAPYDIGTHSSRSTHIVGNAVKIAAENAKQQLLLEASKMLESDVKDLTCRNRKIYTRKDPEREIPLAKVAMSALHGDEPRQIIGTSIYQPSTMSPPFLAQFAEVEVDTETGQVKVLKIVAAHDVGVAINPMLVEAQIEGGISMGLGYALTEGLEVDRKTGKYLNSTLNDYKILSASEMPATEAIIVKSMEPTGPYGAKGVGEPAMVAIAPAIANAVYNAIGARIKELPITAEKILKALQKENN